MKRGTNFMAGISTASASVVGTPLEATVMAFDGNATAVTSTMEMTTTLEQMKNIDIRTVDPSTLVDIKDIQINTSLPRSERILDFLEQVKNPYCFRVGKAAVKISFSDTEATVEDCLERYLLSL